MSLLTRCRRRVGKEEEEGTVPSKAEENKAIVGRFVEELAKGNLGVIEEQLAPDFVDRCLVAGQGPTRVLWYSGRTPGGWPAARSSDRWR
jgi:hypothetical protein